jgi:hypothetical protein
MAESAQRNEEDIMEHAHAVSADIPSTSEIESELPLAEQEVLDQLARDSVTLPRENRYVQAQIDALAWTRAFSRKRATHQPPSAA